MSKGGKIVFWIIIIVFGLSSLLAYTSFSFNSSGVGNDNRVVISPEEKQRLADEATSSTLGEGMEGILKKTSGDNPSYYLDVGGFTLALVESSEQNIDLEKYLDKNVKIWGSFGMGSDEKQIAMQVSKIEVR